MIELISTQQTQDLASSRMYVLYQYHKDFNLLFSHQKAHLCVHPKLAHSHSHKMTELFGQHCTKSKILILYIILSVTSDIDCESTDCRVIIADRQEAHSESFSLNC